MLITANSVQTIASDSSVPGTVDKQITAVPRISGAKALASATALQPVVTETGLISLSVDGLGTTASGTIQVEKPAGATVRKAYMAAADVWGSNGNPGPLPDGAIELNGTPVSWSLHVKLNAVFGGPNHAWADVTNIVKPVVDAAPAGIVDLNVTETIYLDGSILAVIFDDPSQTQSNTIVLMFGAQETTGDTFNVLFSAPIDKSDPNLGMDFSLGISFGYQPSGQVSLVDINGQRLTSSAGGQDDGYSANGGLLTVGGIGDSNANPPDPNAGASNFRDDDELYNILPFVNTGDTSMTINTLNPSNDDSIFFAGLSIKSAVAIVGEGIILGPTSATNPVGTEHTVTATVQDDNGDPVAGRNVDFSIVSGPHAGLTGSDTTDASGQATFAYTGHTAGTDVIEASFVDSNGQTKTSNQVTKTWEGCTAIELKSFNVRTNSNGKVFISWETATEIDNAGFNLYRARTKDGNYKKLNNALIPAKGNDASGATYRYADKPRKGTYYYKLEDVDYYGVSAQHGPEKAKVGSADNASRRSKKARR
ncbi:MAG: PEF-CTERM sorting domain-containing protein [Candidatus Brocadia sp.]|nr:MAG: PEF-CTERM sorting domain-containing protein [Candidatus Brocadia sp.]